IAHQETSLGGWIGHGRVPGDPGDHRKGTGLGYTAQPLDVDSTTAAKPPVLPALQNADAFAGLRLELAERVGAARRSWIVERGRYPGPEIDLAVTTWAGSAPVWGILRPSGGDRHGQRHGDGEQQCDCDCRRRQAAGTSA